MKNLRCLLGIVALLSIVFLTSTFMATDVAHASPTITRQPNATGMGCDTDNSVYYLQLGSCLGYSNGTLRPDAYVTFRIASGRGGIRDCEYTISLIDNYSGNIITDTGALDCTSYARNGANNVHFYGVNYQTSSGIYHSFLSVTTHYNNNSTIANALSSPEVTV